MSSPLSPRPASLSWTRWRPGAESAVLSSPAPGQRRLRSANSITRVPKYARMQAILSLSPAAKTAPPLAENGRLRAQLRRRAGR
eukprot:scaffold561_cov254-Pinguiococcus_pyrenoidosus.AAC.1